jgi:CHAT domain-containing protein
MTKDKENETDLTFTTEQAKQIKELFWKDKEFKNNYFKIRNAWLLQKISVKDAVRLIKE